MALSSPYQLPLFPEKVCSVCGLSWPLDAFNRNSLAKDGRDHRCRECKKAHYRANAEEVKAKVRAYHHAHRDECLERIRAYQEAHRGEVNAQSRQWHAAHRDSANAGRRDRYAANAEQARTDARAYRVTNKVVIKERRRLTYIQNPTHYDPEYYQRHKDAHRRRSARWHKANPLKAAARRARRRARMANADGAFTDQDVRQLYAQQQGLCAYCSIALGGRYEVDHMQPLARGGSNWPDNLCCACPPCNRCKHAKTAEEFRMLLAASRH